MERTTKKKITSFILLILASPLIILAQQGPNFLLPSPQSQELNKYVDFPVDPSTGVPEITIPLYVIKTKGLEIPISLNYHASGLKYGQHDGMVGLGWSLSCDYRVSRTIYGYPDAGNITMSPALYQSQVNDFETNYNTFPERSMLYSDRHLLYPYRDWDRFLRRFIDKDDPDSNMPLMGGMPLDGEYDHFYYSIPNYGGKFIISDRSNQTIHEFNPSMNQIDYNEGASVSTSTSGILNFEIKDAQQNLYTFGEKSDLSGKTLETNRSLLDQRNITAWALTDIDTKYGEKIKFGYKKSTYNGPYKKQLTLNIKEANDVDLWEHYLNTERVQVDYSIFSLASIRTKNLKVDFIESAVSGMSPKIQQLIIRDSVTNSIIRKVEFYYHNKLIDLNNYSFLDSVKIYGSDLVQFEKYSFQYYDQTAYSSGFLDNPIVPDQWGFNQLVSNDLKLLHSGLSNDHIRANGEMYNPIRTGTSNLGFYYSTYIQNRSVNNNPEIYSLKSVVYPTGGSTVYEYEPNQSGTRFTGGIRIKQISHYENEVGVSSTPILHLRKQYLYEIGEVSHILDEKQFRNEYAIFADNGSRRAVTYSSVPFGDFNEHNWGVFYSKVTELMSSEAGILGKYIYKYDFLPGINHDTFAPKIHDPNGLFPYHSQGPRFISSYKDWRKPPLVGKYTYSATGALVKKETFQYTDARLQTFFGLKVRPFSEIHESFNHDFPYYYISSNSIYRYGMYSIETGRNVLFSRKDVEYLHGDSISTITHYENNYHGQITSETISDSKGQNLQVQTVYVWDSPEYFANRMKVENDLNKIIQQTIKRNGVISDRTTHVYKELPNQIFVLDLVKKLNNNSLGDENEYVYHKYDSKGNVQSFTQANGTITNYLWSYDSQYPIAEIKGMSFTELESVLGGAAVINNFSNKNNPSKIEIDAFIAPIRNSLSTGALSNIEVTSFTYDPNLGLITSKADGAGRAEYYEYDGLGRLSIIKGNNKAIKQVIEYNYRNNGGF